MPQKYLFADEAGCFTFTRAPNVSKYFILCTVAMDDCSLAADLIDLRRKLAWDGAELGEYFHATNDKQAVRDAVFQSILQKPFSVQATIMEKCKAQPHIRDSKPNFYQYGWYYHFKYGLKREILPHHEAFVTVASIGTKKERSAFKSAIDDVMRQTIRTNTWATDFIPAGSDPCLQIADYCAWAIQRYFERGDDRSYALIKDRITYQFDLWAHGTTCYY